MRTCTLGFQTGAVDKTVVYARPLWLRPLRAHLGPAVTDIGNANPRFLLTQHTNDQGNDVMAKKSPLELVKEQFGGKDKLVDAVVSLLDGIGTKEDDTKARLNGASNSQLLRLHAVATEVKDSHGTRDKLAGALAEVEGRSKDKDYVAKLETFSAAKLLDMHKAATKRAKAAKKAA